MKYEKKQILQRLKDNFLIPVVRVYNEQDALKIAEILIETGLQTIEITMSVPSAETIIKSLSEKFAGEIIVGAGTVLTSEQAESVYEAGAQFLVSPVFKKDIVKFCKERDLAVIPGASTPTEIYSAYEAGADAVKIFPSVCLGGAKFLKSMKAVFPNIDLVPTGGVNLSNIQEFMEAGAAMAGVGSDLINAKLLRENKIDEMKHRAAAFLDVIKNRG